MMLITSNKIPKTVAKNDSGNNKGTTIKFLAIGGSDNIFFRKPKAGIKIRALNKK